MKPLASAIAAASVLLTPTIAQAHERPVWNEVKAAHVNQPGHGQRLERAPGGTIAVRVIERAQDVRRARRIFRRRLAAYETWLSQQRTPRTTPEPTPEPVVTTGWAIPASIVECESGGDYSAENDVSTASGAYQLIQSTADGAALAIGHPELVGSPASSWAPSLQDAAAAYLYDGGAGAGHWQGCL